MKRLFMVSITAFLLTACTTIYPTSEITSASAGLSSVQTTFENYYSTLNSSGQESYVTTQIYRGAPIDPKILALDGGAYHSPAIAARLKALSLVGRYAELLTAYSGNTQGTALGTAATSFSQSLFSAKDAINAPGAAADKYATPVSSLIGIVTTWGTDLALRSAFRSHIDGVTPQVISILDLLKLDAHNLLEPHQLIDQSAKADAIIASYNNHAATMTIEQRVNLLPTIVTAIDAEEAADQLNLESVIDTAKTAVTTLQARVDGKASEADVASAIEDFVSHVKQIQAQVDAIKAVKG